MTRMILVASLVLLFAPGNARADDSTILVELCQKYAALPKDGEVNAEFIQLKSSCAGFVNSHMMMSKPEDGYCRPENYNMDDLVAVYMDWIGRNHDRISEPTKVTLSAAFAERYPCSK